jgi:hypothetical protein
MRSSRVLVAVVAVLCLVASVNADVITVQGSNGATIAGWTTYTMGTSMAKIGQDNYYYAQYTSSALLAALADPNTVIVSARLVYVRGYTGSVIQNVVTVSEPLYDYTLDTGTDYTSATHMQLIGGNRGAPLLTAFRTCTAAEVVNVPDYTNPEYGPYFGTQSVDVTAIVQDWKAGLESYGCSLGMGATVYENLLYASAMPYLEVTTASVPEPMTMGLLAVGGIGALLRRRSKA